MKELDGQLTFFDMAVIPEQKQKKPDKLGAFVREYHGRDIEDAGSVQSQDFKTFAKRLKRVIAEMCEQIGAEIVSYNTGHYHVSLFLRKGNTYMYLSYDVPRGNCPLDLHASGTNGFLYRLAKNEKDYKGCGNHFCSLLHLKKCVSGLFEQKEKEERRNEVLSLRVS